MGTTLTAVTIRLQDGAGTLVCAHVGDSRLYRFRQDAITQLTRDHTWVQEQVDSGGLTAAAARIHPLSSILTRALGTDEQVAVDSFTTEVAAGDVYLLCTDGLTGMITDDQIRTALADGLTADAACKRLVDEANRAGGKDNITALVVRIES
jgi:protein phosphatase